MKQMKKIMQGRLLLMALSLLCAYVMSCGDDDKTKDNPEDTSSGQYPDGNNPGSEIDSTVIYQIGFALNLYSADTFSSQMKSLSVYVFDLDGKLVLSKTEEGEVLATENYAMELNVAPGTYDIVAWGGLSDSHTWKLAGGSNPKDKDDLVCSLMLTGNGESRQQLDNIFHGMGRVTFPEDVYGTYRAEQVIDLTKDNNHFCVILQNLYGNKINGEYFNFIITDDNGRMDWDNTIVEGNTVIYRDYSKEERSYSVVADIDLGRLIVGHNTVLTVEIKGNNEPIISLPLIDILQIPKDYSGINVTGQEYLDSLDDYELVLFLDDAYNWARHAGIYVNRWLIKFGDNVL